MWEFLKSATDASNVPQTSNKEVCFVGRSNVGKSSLLNAIMKRKIARTSKTPGRTQLINYFVNKDLYLVDLPGYGYAKMAKKAQDKMLNMLENYLQHREQLKKVFVLIDAKVGPTKDDYLIIDFLQKAQKPWMAIITKSDKATQSERHKTIEAIKKLTTNYLLTSAYKNKNIAKFDKIIMSI